MPQDQQASARPHRRIATRYPVLPALLDRWSPRSFAAREPEAEKLRGHGPVHSHLFDCLDDHNKVWAHSAPVLILASVTRRRFSQASGEFVAYSHAMHDLGLSVMSLIVQGQALGLHCHPMAAFDPDKAQETFAIPPLFLPGMMIAVGYLGPADVLPDDLRARETSARTRRPLEELVFEQAWGQASGLFSD
jgi:hypothetical protein